MPLRKFARFLSNPPNWIDLVWLCALGVYVFAGAGMAPFHGDESTQVFMGRDYYYLFLEGDFAKVFYKSDGSESPIEQHLRIVNGTISKTIHGWLAALNGFAAADINMPWDWDYNYDANRALGRIPDAELLRRARLASSAQLVLAVGIFFVCLRQRISRPVAFLGSFLIALDPTALINGRRAMMEGSHMLGMMLVLWAALWLVRERGWWRYPLFGACCGIAIAAKHPNAFIVALAFLACGSWIFYELAGAEERPREGVVRVAAGFLSAAAAALLLFLLLNPAWWRAPVQTASAVLSERMGLLDQQVERNGGYESGYEKIVGFWRHVFMGEIQYFEDAQWADYSEIEEQIADYEASGWAGARIGGSVAGGLLSVALTAAGVFIFARDSRIHPDARWLILLWGGGSALITLAVTPLSWTRYYLPLLPVVALFVAVAIVGLARHSSAGLKNLVHGVNVLD